MPQHWIVREFSRTGLPKSALAGYLGIDNAAVSRIINGERQLSTDEEGLVRAFFSIVPSDTDGSLTEAIHRLRSTKIREAASFTLAKWLLERTHRSQDGLQDRLQPKLLSVTAQNSSLRADQIVALCRLLRINVGELVRGNGVNASNFYDGGRPPNILGELEKEARRWNEGASIPYQFDRSFNAPLPRAGGTRINSVMLQPAEIARDELAFCTPYLIPDNSHAPRFEQGQTIYVDERSDPRKGDYVAVVLSDPQPDIAKAVLGKLLYVSRETVGILSARNARVELSRAEVGAVRRIAYCKL
jgi:hypothetical protein